MVCALLLALATAGFAETVEYRLQSGGANKISLEVEKTGLLRGKKHIIDFTRFDGKLSYDAQTPSNSKVELRIEAASLKVNDDWVKDKDKEKVRKEALDVLLLAKQYPDMRFVSTKISPKGGNSFSVDGTLTIRGVAKPVTLDVTLDPSKPAIDGKGAFKMTAYGMKPPSAGLGTVGTKDEMLAKFSVVAQR